ncbi:sodium:solute symporter family protein [Pseudohongiella sp. SYSU M77423]|uniref:sodium:solute symporter family protein n=1 Tax=Pseudohongiella sp. SYSU M77423 TaxID=3042312 RepID=UPI0024818096|nr:sodium:solute symporter family protein [Pseudohongiella sp. SYSU M77423]MDH7945056.1 sodium:solute symporter family protein [Pseudohongiella sp. SYSU M77423]MEC8858853.1 sodium:solute symporter family protein [Pseudomonadota bacterium]
MDMAGITIIVYLVVVTLVGMYLTKHSSSSDDWAIGGGGMGLWLIAAGIAGTRIGGAGTYGVAGDTMNTGVWNMWYGVNSFLALALVGIFFAVPYRRLRLTTIGELFVKRHDSQRNGRLTSLCVQTEYLIINILEPLLIGIIISAVFGINRELAIMIGALIIISSTTLSGLRGASATNVIHVVVVTFGLLAVAMVAGAELGGISGIKEKVDAALAADPDTNAASWWSFVGLGWFPVIAMFFSAVIHTPAASVYVNYSSSARRENLLIPAFLLAGVLAALMPVLASIIGIEAVARYGTDSGITSYATITRIATDTGPIIGGIALAAVLAALISSGGPILLSSATLFVNDWIPGSKDFEPKRKLRSYRITSVIYGLFAGALACVLPITSVLELLLLGFAMVVPPALAIGFIFYWRKTTEQGVFWGIASGYGLGLAGWAANTFVLGLENDVAAYFTTLVPLVVIPVVSLMTQSPQNEGESVDNFYQALKTPVP